MKVATIFPKSESDEWHIETSFVGREKELAALANDFREGKRVVQISGGFGMGKTALAWMFAHHQHEQYPGGIFKTHAFGPESVEHMLDRVLPPVIQEPALLIIDDAGNLDKEDIETLRSRARQVPRLKVLLTTRQAFPPEGADEALVTALGLTKPSTYDY